MPPTAAHDAAADGYAVALEEARRALDEQERAVAQLSVRAGVLLSAAAIVTSFLGGTALARGEIGVASWIAIAAFTGLCGTTLSILRPRQDWEFAMRPARLIRAYVEPLAAGSGAPPIRRQLALYMGSSLDRNLLQLDRLVTRFHIASVLLATEVLAWVASIATDG